MTSSRSDPRLVLFHGLASTSREFGMLQHPLRRAGIDLLCLEVPGYTHGSAGMASARWRDWRVQAGRAVDALAAQDGRPLVLGGLCTGAMLAAALVAERPERACGLLMLSPLLAYDGWGLPWWYGLRHLAYLLGLSQRFSMREREPFGLKNERMRQWIRQQMLSGETTAVGPASVNLHVVRESERLSRHVRRELPRLDLPTCTIHAREDEICALASVESVLSTMPREHAQFTVLDNSYHMITADNDRPLVIERIGQFMAQFAVREPRAPEPVPLTLPA